MAKVSVVVPVYNGARYIEECMDSIISQTLKEIEIIVIDAGSSDGTVEILRSYAERDDRVKLLFSDKKSMGCQTNMGIAASTGEYIGFCEADDYLASSMYEQLYAAASISKLDFVKSDFDMFIGEDTRLFLNYRILNGEKRALYDKVIRPMEYPELVFRDVNMWNGIYNREFLIENHIKLNETPGAAFQDAGFVLQTLAFAEKTAYVQKAANRYRRDNMSSSVYDQKSLLYVVWEFNYACRMVMDAEIQNQRFLAVVFQRFLDLFCGFYARLPETHLFTDEVCQAINEFKNLLRKFYSMLDYSSRTITNLDSSLDLKLLLEDSPFFDIYRKKTEELKKEQLHSFYRQICKFSKAVIFGAGEFGRSCYGMLKNNGYQGILCFCDNDRKLWNREIMGLKVLPAEWAVNKKEEILFIIANAEHWQEIYCQLSALGVESRNICKAVNIIPHCSFETKLN